MRNAKSCWKRRHWLTVKGENTTRAYFILFFLFSLISWRPITLQYCSGSCHTLTWISLGYTCIPHPDPPPTSLSTRSLWVFPVHQVRALVSCIQPGLVICFTQDNIHVSMLFSTRAYFKRLVWTNKEARHLEGKSRGSLARRQARRPLSLDSGGSNALSRKWGKSYA